MNSGQEYVGSAQSQQTVQSQQSIQGQQMMQPNQIIGQTNPMQNQPMQNNQQAQNNQMQQQIQNQDPNTQQQQVQGQGPQIHHFEAGMYSEVIQVLSEFSGFVIGELQKPEPMTHMKIAQMLQLYIQHCLMKGPGDENPVVAPAGTTCQHQFSHGKRSGETCNAPAKCMGVDNLPRCTSHKKTKGRKLTLTDSGSTEPGAAGQTFSYAANATKGRTVGQSLTSIQQAITDQMEPAKLHLMQTPDNRFFHQDSGLVFEERYGQWICVGVMDGDNTRMLTELDTYVCYGNMWKWDPARVDKKSSEHGHSCLVDGDHPLVQSSAGSIQKKLDSVIGNSL